MPKPKKTLRERQLDAEQRCSGYLADANEAAERGEQSKADKLYAKSQFWLDRFNLLTNWGDKPAPKQ